MDLGRQVRRLPVLSAQQHVLQQLVDVGGGARLPGLGQLESFEGRCRILEGGLGRAWHRILEAMLESSVRRAHHVDDDGPAAEPRPRRELTRVNVARGRQVARLDANGLAAGAAHLDIVATVREAENRAAPSVQVVAAHEAVDGHARSRR